MRFNVNSTLLAATLALSAAQTGLAAPTPQDLSSIPVVGPLLSGATGAASGSGASNPLSAIPVVGSLLSGATGAATGSGAGNPLGSLLSLGTGLLGRSTGSSTAA